MDIHLSHLYQIRVLMELAFYTAFGFLCLACVCLCLYCYMLRRAYYRERDRLIDEVGRLERNSTGEIERRWSAVKRAEEAEAALAQAKEELKKADERPLSIEASQLLHDLTRTGNAVVRIVPLDPKELFYRAPRG